MNLLRFKLISITQEVKVFNAKRSARLSAFRIAFDILKFTFYSCASALGLENF